VGGTTLLTQMSMESLSYQSLSMMRSRTREINVIVVVKDSTRFRSFGRNTSTVRKSVQLVRRFSCDARYCTKYTFHAKLSPSWQRPADQSSSRITEMLPSYLAGWWIIVLLPNLRAYKDNSGRWLPRYTPRVHHPSCEGKVSHSLSNLDRSEMYRHMTLDAMTRTVSRFIAIATLPPEVHVAEGRTASLPRSMDQSDS
jgi:hypothetical protein